VASSTATAVSTSGTSSTSTTTGSSSTTGSTSDTAGKINYSTISNNSDTDIVIISNPPSTVTATGSFNVTIAYAASASRDIVVDLMDTDESWYGKGTATVAAGKGPIVITVTVQNSPSQSNNYQLHAWIVDAGQADVTNAWNSAYDNDYQSVSVGSSLVTFC
jgi:hypothetical protein